MCVHAPLQRQTAWARSSKCSYAWHSPRDVRVGGICSRMMHGITEVIIVNTFHFTLPAMRSSPTSSLGIGESCEVADDGRMARGTASWTFLCVSSIGGGDGLLNVVAAARTCVVDRHKSHVTRRMSRVTSHTHLRRYAQWYLGYQHAADNLHRTSHVTRHTSHVTRHVTSQKSQAISHTSHITRHISPAPLVCF